MVDRSDLASKIKQLQFFINDIEKAVKRLESSVDILNVNYTEDIIRASSHIINLKLTELHDMLLRFNKHKLQFDALFDDYTEDDRIKAFEEILNGDLDDSQTS